MPDVFDNKAIRLNNPASNGELINISTTDHVLTNTSRMIWMGAAGALKVDLAGSTGITLSAIPVGTMLSIRATKVYKTGSVASTLLVALW